MENDLLSQLKVSIELGRKKRLSGNDLFAMLEKVMLLGSISKAAAEMGVSYRYAWGLLKEAEKSLGMTLVEKKIGGHTGGGASLTADGTRLLMQYKSFKEEVDSQLNRFLVNKYSKKELKGTARQGQAQMLTQVSGRHLLLASTVEPAETGLLDILEQAFYQVTGILVRHIAVGSGRALEIARAGRVDMALTHAPELEDRFMQEGWGKLRVPVMRNDYVIVGPVSDSAGIRELAGRSSQSLTAADIFRQIAAAEAAFVSRGDNSGTHLRELQIWEAAGVKPETHWYHVCPGVVGNLGILNYATEKGAYTLADMASFIISQLNEKTCIILEGSQDDDDTKGLRNIFSLIVINPELVAGMDYEGALAFADWLQGKSCRSILQNFGREKYGRPLFTV
ncbi:MAG: substrate-binding domain-containing protein [Bacillota bacterium]